jgi:hypothetical protein
MIPLSMSFLAGFAGLLTTALVHFAWQGAFLSLLLLAVVKLLGVRAVRLRYLLSVGTLLLMGMAPIVTVIWHHRSRLDQEHPHAKDAVASNPIAVGRPGRDVVDPPGPLIDVPSGVSAAASHPGIEFYVLLAWLAGASLLSTRLAIGLGVTWNWSCGSEPSATGWP